MPGDEWQKFANAARLLRLHVGPSGQEAAVHGPGVRPARANGISTAASTGTLLELPAASPACRRLRARPQPRCTATSPALHARDCEAEGFRWIVVDDAEQSVYAWLRLGGRRRRAGRGRVATSPRCRAAATASACRIAGRWREILNTDARHVRRLRRRQSRGGHGRADALARVPGIGRCSLVPPLATVYLRVFARLIRTRPGCEARTAQRGQAARP